MRLLQLATADKEFLDLHPNVSVVTGLDAAARRLVTEVVTGLARGTATGPKGLLEAHGVLFDLAPDMLELLEVANADIQPVVSASDLPTARRDPRARERSAAERALAEAEELAATAREEHARALAAVDAAAQTVDRAHRAIEAAEADATGRIRSIDSLTSAVDHAIEQRRRLEEERARLAPRVERAATERAEVEAATAEVRERRQAAAARCSDLSARIEEAKQELDPGAPADAELAAATLAEVEAQVAEERAAEAASATQPAQDPAEQLERVQQRMDELDKRLAAFGPTDLHPVEAARDQLRAVPVDELVPVPEAQALAGEIAAVESELRAVPGGTGAPEAMAVVRTRLDDARHALLVAEQAVRNPELDRALVDRLEQAHAELLDAIDRADSRFGGARAQRKVDALRTAEHAILDELGFTSYSDYMMGNSLLHVDPAKEAALDAAREELASAEDAWRAIEADTDAELARAEVVERRRQLVEQASALLGGRPPTGTVIESLRALRASAPPPTAHMERLRHALDAAGVALGDEELDRDDLLMVTTAWLDEAAASSAREAEVWAELKELAVERAALQADVEAAAARAPAPEQPSPEERRVARLEAARRDAEQTAARRQRHLEAEARVAGLAQELAGAAEEERMVGQATADADAAVMAAQQEEQRLVAELARIERELDVAITTEAESGEQLRALADPEAQPSSDQLEADLEAAEAAFVAAQAALAPAAQDRVVFDEERTAAASALAELATPTANPDEGASAAEEVEWYLLARLAAQRAVSLGGSLPLVLDDALVGLDEDEVGHVLGRLERMAEAVQVIVLTDDPLASSWALMAGEDRAALVRPTAY